MMKLNRRLWIGCGLIFLLGLSIYFANNIFLSEYQFLDFDDDRHISSQVLIQHPNRSNLARIWLEPLNGLYIPVTYSVWWSISRFLGFYPVFFHRVNVLVHGLNGLLVFLLLLHYLGRWQREKRGTEEGVLGCAFVSTFLFLWHPVQVEAVAWISEFRGLLGTFLGLIAILSYSQQKSGTVETSPVQKSVSPGGASRRQEKLQAARRQSERGRFWREWGSGLAKREWTNLGFIGGTCAFILALLAKPAVAIIPFAIWVFESFCFRSHSQIDSNGIRRRMWLGTWTVLAVPFLFFTKSLQPDSSLAWVPPLGARFFIAGDTLSFYLTKLLLPFHLVPDYGRTPGMVEQRGFIYWTWILALGVWIGIWRIRKNHPILCGVILSWGLSLIPVLGWVCFDYQRISTVADRYLYFSVFFWAFGLGAFCLENGRKALFLFSIYLLVMGAISFQQISIWKNNFTVFNRTLQVNPQSFVAHNNLGIYYLNHEDPEKAIEHLEHSVRILPLAEPLTNLGVAMERQGRFVEAIRYHERALALLPNNPVIQKNLLNAQINAKAKLSKDRLD